MKRSQVPHSHWTNCVIALLAQLSLPATIAGAAASDGNQVHAFQWQKASPASQQMDGAKLEALRDSLAGRQTKAFLVIRNDRIVYEWYAEDHGPDKPHYTASMAKALVGGVALAVAISDGCIGLDDPAAKYVPQWRQDPRKAKITIRHLGSHTSGIEDSSVVGLPLVAPWGGGGYTARATARVGRLMLREGDWEGRRLISPEAVRLVTCDAGTPGNCGIGWWNNNEGGFPELPKDAFWGAGAGHQVVFVVPSLHLIAVRNGGTLGTGTGHHEALRVHLFRPLVETIPTRRVTQ